MTASDDWKNLIAPATSQEVGHQSRVLWTAVLMADVNTTAAAGRQVCMPAAGPKGLRVGERSCDIAQGRYASIQPNSWEGARWLCRLWDMPVLARLHLRTGANLEPAWSGCKP